MKNKSANQRRKTAQFQLTSRFSLILFGLLILFNLLFILLSVGYLFEHIENRASNILEAIEKGEASGDASPFSSMPMSRQMKKTPCK